MDDGLRTFGAAVGALDLELDWALLGGSYCEGDGRTFFDATRRERILETGFLLADEVTRALGGRRGTSLYLGADVAELPVILAEHLVLQRSIHWLNVDAPGPRELARALRVVGARLGLELPVPSARAVGDLDAASCDHLWMVSVLTDPDHFPALHDALYERAGGPEATRRGALDTERRQAEALIDAWLDRARSQCVLTTTDEERTLVEPRVADRGWRLAFQGAGRLSAIVGDSIRIGILRRP